jgi:hypothetical protein
MIFTAALLSATDFGLELKNTGGIEKIEDAEFYTDHKATLWATIPFNNANSNSLAIEGSFYASKPAGVDEFDYYVDVDLFRLSLTAQQNEKGKIIVDAGRFPVADATGILLSQGLDGVEVRGIRSFGNFSFLAGYTGLLNARQEKNLMTTDDVMDILTDDIYALGAKRAVAKVTFQFPELFGGADLVMEALGQYDLREQFDSDAHETVHTGYGTIAVNGPITTSVFYSLSGTFQTGVLDSDDTYSEHALLGVARVEAFPVPVANIFAEFVYTTGENDFFSHLLPITFQSAGTLYDAEYGNLMRAKTGVFYTPMDILNIDFGASLFMYSKETDEADGLYSATEVNAGATFKATSDLRLRFDGTLLFPKDDDMQYQAEITVVFNL